MAMSMSFDEWRGMMMVVGNHVRVSAMRSELMAHAQTR
jgi:hypothetical protein